MKKLLFMLLFAITSIAASAQTNTFSIGNGTIIEPTNSYTLTNTTAQWFLFKGYTDWTTTQDVQVHLDSLAGNHTNVAVALYGRKWSTNSWTQIGLTVNWKGTTTDTTVTISNATAARWREYKLLLTGTGTGTTTMSGFKLKVWYQ